MIEIVGVRFKKVGKIYYFDPCGKKIEKNMHVVVETARGVELGEAAIENKMVDDNEVTQPLKPVLRIATKDDLRQAEENKEKEKAAFKTCLEKIEEHKLVMKLIDVEYTFDRGKILFYFTADGRVDFRGLVKDLAAIFKTRIELRQIGVRDEAKMLGGLGICGRNLCCNGFLGEFIPVSIKMAKEQGLSLNPAKISGVCGRLMCCLKYEQDVYEEMGKGLPGHGAVVKTPDGQGIVFSVSTLKRRISVRLDSNPIIKEYDADEISIIKHASNSDDEFSSAELKELEEN